MTDQQKHLTEKMVGQLATRPLLTCPPDTCLHKAAALMYARQCCSIIIQDQHQMLGIWTEADALKLNYAKTNPGNIAISQVMSSPVACLSEHAMLSEAVTLFRQQTIRHCLVTFDQGQDGIITQTDLTLSMGLEYFLNLRTVKSVKTPVIKLPVQGTSLALAVEEMRRVNAEAIVVTDQGKAVGILTQHDILAVLASASPPPSLTHIACKQLITINEQDSMLNARNTLITNGIRHLVTLNDHEEVSGLLSMHNILHVTQQEYNSELRKALKQRNEALEESKYNLQLAQQVIDSSRDGIVVTDGSTQIISVNPAFTRITGYEPQDAIGQKMSFLQSGRQSQDFYQKMWQSIMAQGYWRGEIWNKRKNDEIYPELLTVTAIRDTEGKVRNFTGLFSDITQQKRNEERIRKLAYFDELTGLPNRRMFNDRLQMAISNARRHGHTLALLFIDVDLFKRINDNLGHSVGDMVLRELANRLKKLIREEDTLARLGGDEFVILFQELDDLDCLEQWLQQVNERITETFKQPIHFGENKISVTNSVGIAIFPDDGDNAEQLLKNADTAMYRAKEDGRNNLKRFKPVMEEQGLRQLSVEAQLRTAIKNQELTVHYQPQFDLRSGNAVGAEALLRWTNQTLGQVSPIEFIPVAEEQGLINELGLWVLKQACRESLVHFTRAQSDLRISVNISPLQLRQPDFVNGIEQALKETQLPPQNLELEITETALIDDSCGARSKLLALKELGITIALDDFGTGYSSLSYLQNIPLDRLKIDASFVQRLSGKKQDAQIVMAIIAMAQSMGLEVVAEGAETLQQMQHLQQLNCDLVQGYFTGRAVPIAQLKTELEKGQHRSLPEAV